MRQTNGVQGPVTQETDRRGTTRVLQAALCSSPQPYHCRARGRTSAGYGPLQPARAALTLYRSAIWVEPWSLHASSLFAMRGMEHFLLHFRAIAKGAYNHEDHLQGRSPWPSARRIRNCTFCATPQPISWPRPSSACTPQADFAFGPATENGFYYDVDLGDTKLTDEDLASHREGDDARSARRICPSSPSSCPAPRPSS